MCIELRGFSQSQEWRIVTVESVDKRVESVWREKFYVEWLKSVPIVSDTFD